jgi:hypothetical protein
LLDEYWSAVSEVKHKVKTKERWPEHLD